MAVKPLLWMGTSREDLRGAGGAYRILLVTKLAEGIYVLHAFMKKTRQTARLDLELGAKRYREVLAQRRGR